MTAAYPIFTKELGDALRSRWLVTYAAAFAVVALGLALLQDGGIGVQGFDRTTASLLNLCLLLVPLLALIVGAGAIAGERERGTLATLLSQPLSSTELLVSKYAGLAVALWMAIALGFGVAGVALALVRPVANFGHYLLFIGLAAVLATAMLSVGVLISVVSANRVKALSIAVLLWFALVLLYDLVAIGLAVALTSNGQALLLATLLNPVEAVRILAVLGLEPDLHILGPMGAYLRLQFGVAQTAMLLSTATLIWTAVPLAVAAALFRRQDA